MANDKKNCLRVSTTNLNEAVTVTNNRAQYFADLAKKYSDEAKAYRDNAKLYAEQNADVTFEYINNVKVEISREINSKVEACVLKTELPKISELENDANYFNALQVNNTISDSLSKILSDCILEAPNGIAEISSSGIVIKSGLKMLIAKGRKADKTLDNIEMVLSDDITIEPLLGTTQKILIGISSNGVVENYGNIWTFIESDEQPTSVSSYIIWYSPKDNLYRLKTPDTDWAIKEICFPIWYYTDAEEVLELGYKNPFRAVDINDVKNLVDKEIGKPHISLDSILPKDCVWLEGATVSRTTYSQLFALYGTTYGVGDGSTTFQLPDFRNRAIWGANSFGYVSAGLPNITGTFCGGDCDYRSGAFTSSALNGSKVGAGSSQFRTFTFNASASNSIYGSSTTVQPPAIKVRVYTKYQ